MKHRVAGRKLGRTSAHRLALMRNMSTSLIDKERIITTLHKAKELRKFAERLVTLAKRETLHARRRVLRHIPDRRLVAKLFDTLSARYAQRPGGYTRIVKLGPRRGDAAEMAIIELVGAEVTREGKGGKVDKDDKGAGAEAAAKAAPGKKPTKKTAGGSTPDKSRAKSGRKSKSKAAASEEKAKPKTSSSKRGPSKDGSKATKGTSRSKG